MTLEIGQYLEIKNFYANFLKKNIDLNFCFWFQTLNHLDLKFKKPQQSQSSSPQSKKKNKFIAQHSFTDFSTPYNKFFFIENPQMTLF